MNMWNKQGKSLSIIICSKWKGRFVVREYTPPPHTHTHVSPLTAVAAAAGFSLCAQIAFF